MLHGSLITEKRYFAELAESSPLLRALDPRAGLLGDGYGKDVAAESGRYTQGCLTQGCLTQDCTGSDQVRDQA